MTDKNYIFVFLWMDTFHRQLLLRFWKTAPLLVNHICVQQQSFGKEAVLENLRYSIILAGPQLSLVRVLFNYWQSAERTSLTSSWEDRDQEKNPNTLHSYGKVLFYLCYRNTHTYIYPYIQTYTCIHCWDKKTTKDTLMLKLHSVISKENRDLWIFITLSNMLQKVLSNIHRLL